MPHLVIEYSENLRERVKETQLLKTLHTLVVDSGLFAPSAVKGRSLAYSDYVLPEGANSFIHITLSILAGRTLEQRVALNEKLFQTVHSLIGNVDKLSCNLHEMDKDTYRKL